MDGFLAVNAAGQARALACEPDSGSILRALSESARACPRVAGIDAEVRTSDVLRTTLGSDGHFARPS
jgi:hypothetical protein